MSVGRSARSLECSLSFLSPVFLFQALFTQRSQLPLATKKETFSYMIKMVKHCRHNRRSEIFQAMGTSPEDQQGDRLSPALR